MQAGFAEPSGSARADAARVLDSIYDRQEPGRDGVAVLIALLHLRQQQVEVDEILWQQLERAVARLLDANLPADAADVDRARVLVTDVALQRVAELRLDSLGSGAAGMSVHAGRPEVRHLEELGEFSSLKHLADIAALQALADGRYDRLPAKVGSEVALQLRRSLRPLSPDIEASLRSATRNYSSALHFHRRTALPGPQEILDATRSSRIVAMEPAEGPEVEAIDGSAFKEGSTENIEDAEWAFIERPPRCYAAFRAVRDYVRAGKAPALEIGSTINISC